MKKAMKALFLILVAVVAATVAIFLCDANSSFKDSFLITEYREEENAVIVVGNDGKERVYPLSATVWVDWIQVEEESNLEVVIEKRTRYFGRLISARIVLFERCDSCGSFGAST